MERLVGKPAPEFVVSGVKAGEIKKYSLLDYRGKWVVLFFYPLDFTFVCPTEVKGFNAQYAEFQKLNAEILGVSVDSVHSHQAWAESLGGISFPLLSDFRKEMSKAYGVYLEEDACSLRGTFIIDPEGVVRYLVISDNNVGRSSVETLRVVQALQTGKLCPLEWTMGQKTLN